VGHLAQRDERDGRADVVAVALPERQTVVVLGVRLVEPVDGQDEIPDGRRSSLRAFFGQPLERLLIVGSSPRRSPPSSCSKKNRRLRAT
jgi:Na+-transporting NADH:ubiquinone oxidoreductase subunit NqrF